jgi:hypothetical protein
MMLLPSEPSYLRMAYYRDSNRSMIMTAMRQELPRSPAKLGDALFSTITALRMSRLEISRAGYTDCVAVLDEAYSL